MLMPAIPASRPARARKFMAAEAPSAASRALDRGAPGTPDIDAGEQEQPHHVDEMPVPGREFEAQMLLRRKLAELGAEQADDQEYRADDDMRAVEAGRHEKGGAVDRIRKGERRMIIFPTLNAGEAEAENNGQRQSDLQTLTVVVQQRVMRPGDRRAGGEQDQGVEQRQIQRIEHLGALGRPDAAGEGDARLLNRLAGEQ